MSIKFNRSQTFATNGTVTAAGLHNLVDGLDIYQALITDQTSLSAVAPEDSILIADASLTAGDAPRQTTVQNLFDDGLSSGTYTSLNLSGALTYGTATGNRTISTSATITTGTIPNLTAGTTTSTAATITTGTIPSLTAGTTTSTGASITNGTIATLNSTTGTIATINSTTGTIGNLSTTLAGDLAISQGTATLGTSGVTAGTYGGSSSIPTIVVDAKGRVTTASTSAVSSGLTGFRNRIINGDMRIDQRNAGGSVTPITGDYTVDRWNYYSTQTSKATIQRNAGSVTPPSGFTNYLGVTSLSSYSVGTSDYFIVTQPIEGFNVSDLGFGTASAKTITVSFWVRSSLTGTFGGIMENSSQTRAYPFSYTISSANTWEQKSVTIAGDTSGTWVTDNGLGLWLMFSLGAGSAISGTAGAWVGSQKLGVTGATSVVGTNGATWYITGVQLEAGSTATDFERRPYGTELALCQRYYFRYDASANITAIGAGSVYSATTTSRIYMQYPVSMRSAPTFTIGGTLTSSGGNADNTVSGISSANAGITNALIDFTTSAATVGHGKTIYVSGGSSSFIQGASEL